MRAVLGDNDVWIYGNDGFIVMGTGQNSSGILCYFGCHILSGYCHRRKFDTEEIQSSKDWGYLT